MFIGIVGGFDRDASKLVEIGRQAGHRVECHTGVISGGATAVGLRNLVGRSDYVVIVTDMNSHGAVRLARSVARRSNRPTQLVRRLGPTQFEAMLQAMPQTSQASSSGSIGRAGGSAPPAREGAPRGRSQGVARAWLAPA